MAQVRANPVTALPTAALPDDAAGFAQALIAQIDAMGAGRNAYLARLVAGPLPTRDIAVTEAIHFLAILHGTHPSFAELMDDGVSTACPAAVSAWLTYAAATIEYDRQWLTRLVLLAGPTPLAWNLTQTEVLVRNQRDAMLTLARSERAACALGAAIALAHEWDVIRCVLAEAAALLWHDRVPTHDHAGDPSLRDLSAFALDAAADTPAARRALSFGARQLVGIHGSLWDLLEGRHARFASKS